MGLPFLSLLWVVLRWCSACFTSWVLLPSSLLLSPPFRWTSNILYFENIAQNNKNQQDRLSQNRREETNTTQEEEGRPPLDFLSLSLPTRVVLLSPPLFWVVLFSSHPSLVRCRLPLLGGADFHLFGITFLVGSCLCCGKFSKNRSSPTTEKGGWAERSTTSGATGITAQEEDGGPSLPASGLGAPHGAVTPLQPQKLSELLLPRLWERCVLSPRCFVRLVHFTLLRLLHQRPRTLCGVMEGRRQLHGPVVRT